MPILFKSLSKNDATFVDIIHTDAGHYGTTESLGTHDFWYLNTELFHISDTTNSFMYLQGQTVDRSSMDVVN